MGVTENIETVRSFYGAGAAADDSERPSYFAPTAVWHVPGNNPVSGDYVGVDAITRVMGERMQPLDEWAIEPIQIMGNANLVMAVVDLRGQRRGRTLTGAGGHVFRFDDAGRIVEAWGFIDDQAAADEMFRA